MRRCLRSVWVRRASSALAATATSCAKLKALHPTRIFTLALGDKPIANWMRERTDELGADVLVDCSARGASAAVTAEALKGLKRGGVAVNIGALTEPLPIEPMRFMTSRLHFRGSNWFTTGEGQLMAEMASTGVLDLSHLTPKPIRLTA